MLEITRKTKSLRQMDGGSDKTFVIGLKPQTTTNHRRTLVKNRRTLNRTPKNGRIMCRPVPAMTAGRDRTLFQCYLEEH